MVFDVSQICPGQNANSYVGSANFPRVAACVSLQSNGFAFVVPESVDEINGWVDVRAELRDFASQDVKRSCILN